MTEEVLDSLANLEIAQTGIERLLFKQWSDLERALEPAMTERFASWIKHVKNVSVCSNRGLKNEQAKQSLFEMTAQIISSAQGLTEVQINGNFFSASLTT